MWSRLDTERKHSSLAAGDQRLPGRRSSDGGRKTYLQPPLLRAASHNKEETERRTEEIREGERERKGGTGEEVEGGKIDEGNEKGTEESRKKVETVEEEGMKTEGEIKRCIQGAAEVWQDGGGKSDNRLGREGKDEKNR